MSINADGFWDRALENTTALEREVTIERERSFHKSQGPSFKFTRHDTVADPNLKALQQMSVDDSEVPKSVSEFIEHLKDLSPVEQLHLTHEFVNTNMKYCFAELNDVHGSEENAFIPSEVLKNWRSGDCDNHAPC